MTGSTSATLAHDPARWPGKRQRTYRPDGEVREKWVHSAGGVGLTFWPSFNVLWAEASLPKLVDGRNDVELDADGEAAALALMDDRLRSLLPFALPPFASWAPVRLDVVRQVRVGSAGRLQQVLRTLRDVEVPRWGRPSVGQSLSLWWGNKGRQGARIYDKFTEVKETGHLALGPSVPSVLGDRAGPPTDLLRAEGVLRQASVIRRLMHDRHATLAAAMRSGVGERPLLRVWPMVERILEGDVKEEQVLKALLKKYSFVTAVRLLGFARAVHVLGVDGLSEGMDRVTIWRGLHDLRDAGVEPAAVEWDTPAWGEGALRGLHSMNRKAKALQERERRRRETRETA